MWKSSWRRGRRGVTLPLIGMAVVFASVVTVTGVAIANSSSDSGLASAADQARTDWPTNADGQTYGKAPDAKSFEDRPDLIEAVATNGAVGYVLKSDAYLPAPETAEEALEMTKASLRGREIPVYGSDGVTQIGVFKMGGAKLTGTLADGSDFTQMAEADGTIVTTVVRSDGIVIETMETLDGAVTTKTMAPDGTTPATE